MAARVVDLLEAVDVEQMTASWLCARSDRLISLESLAIIERRLGNPVSGSVSDSSWVCSNTSALLTTAAACSATRASRRRWSSV